VERRGRRWAAHHDPRELQDIVFGPGLTGAAVDVGIDRVDDGLDLADLFAR
jgi:hypothetical protein